MKKYFIFAAAVLLSGCASWSEWDFNWNSLNPWAEDKAAAAEEAKPAAAAKEQDVLPAEVNKYLWHASLEKLAFMGIEVQNPEDGLIVTGWKTMSAAQNERFKISAEILCGELRADGLDVKVYKEIKNGSGWRAVSPSPALKTEVEQAIIKQAKILYINDRNKE